MAPLNHVLLQPKLAYIEDLLEDRRVLLVGSDHGYASRFLARRAQEVVVVDPSAVRLRYSRNRHPARNVTYQQASLEDTGYPDGFFDVVVALAPAFTLEDCRHLLAELRRVLDPDGFLYLALPGPGPRLQAMPQVQPLDPPELRNALRRFFPHVELLLQRTGLGITIGQDTDEAPNWQLPPPSGDRFAADYLALCSRLLIVPEDRLLATSSLEPHLTAIRGRLARRHLQIEALYERIQELELYIARVTGMEDLTGVQGRAVSLQPPGLVDTELDQGLDALLERLPAHGAAGWSTPDEASQASPEDTLSPADQGLEAGLEAHRAALSRLEAELRDRTEEIHRLQSELRTRNADISRLEDALRAQEGDAARQSVERQRLEAALESQRDEAARLRDELNRLRDEHLRLDDAAQKRDSEVVRLSSEVRRLEDVIQARDTAISRLESERRMLEAASTQPREASSEAEEQLQHLRRELEQLEGLLQDRSTEIARLEGLVHARDTEVSRLEGLVVARDAEIAPLRAELQRLEAEIHRLESLLQSESETRARLEPEARRLGEVMKEREAEVWRLESEVRRLASDVQERHAELLRAEDENLDLRIAVEESEGALEAAEKIRAELLEQLRTAQQAVETQVSSLESLRAEAASGAAASAQEPLGRELQDQQKRHEEALAREKLKTWMLEERVAALQAQLQQAGLPVPPEFGEESVTFDAPELPSMIRRDDVAYLGSSDQTSPHEVEFTPSPAPEPADTAGIATRPSESTEPAPPDLRSWLSEHRGPGATGSAAQQPRFTSPEPSFDQLTPREGAPSTTDLLDAPTPREDAGARLDRNHPADEGASPAETPFEGDLDDIPAEITLPQLSRQLTAAMASFDILDRTLTGSPGSDDTDHEEELEERGATATGSIPVPALDLQRALLEDWDKLGESEQEEGTGSTVSFLLEEEGRSGAVAGTTTGAAPAKSSPAVVSSPPGTPSGDSARAPLPPLPRPPGAVSYPPTGAQGRTGFSGDLPQRGEMALLEALEEKNLALLPSVTQHVEDEVERALLEGSLEDMIQARFGVPGEKEGRTGSGSSSSQEDPGSTDGLLQRIISRLRR